MPRFRLTMTAVFALAAPAWASYPPPAVSDGYPVPYGYPVAGYANGAGYPAPPDMLPPGGPAYGSMPPPGYPNWNGSPAGVMPAGYDPGVNPGGYAFDPSSLPQQGRAHSSDHEFWVRGDWLYWSFRDVPVPSLITTGNPALADPAVPGRGNATSLGSGPRDVGKFNGARASVGMWFDPDCELGGEVTGFLFGRRASATFFNGTAATPVISSPVIGVTGVATVYDFAFPGQFNGALGIRTATQLFGAEANLLHRWKGDGAVTIDGLFGYRHLQLNERLDLLGQSQATGAMGTFGGAILPPGVTVFTNDSFRAHNEFHGAQIGGQIELRQNRFTLTAYGKGGAGVNLQTLHVDGSTTAIGFGVTRTLVGGIRALPSNFGRDTNNDFSMIGETGLEFGFQATKHLTLRVGYNALFWSDVLRPGNVIDPVVNFGQVPIDPTFGQAGGTRRPVTVFRSSDFLAHGVVVGVVLDY